MEKLDIRLGKARYSDWEAMYRNVWSRTETARYMHWEITTSAQEAQAKMERTILYQKTHDTYLVYELSSGQAIGFAGVERLSEHVYCDAGIALGPEYVGKGYGKQILLVLLEYCRSFWSAKEFLYSTKSTNTASRSLAISCGFSYLHSERKIDSLIGEPYELMVYVKKL